MYPPKYVVGALTPSASECGLIWTQSLYRGNWTALVAQTVTNLPAMWETCVRSLGWEDPLEKGTVTPLQYSGLENSKDCRVHRVAKSQTRLSNFHFQ